ncbi:nitrous oxide reductase accessory protein NosL [Sulfurimonas sp. NWX367]|uniref:nitrous oxide reductase accessory protein NosL n=1 Tax=unclassified Sulfurimonas TaxID=2623549 RepID=UPI003204CEA7
MVKALLVSLSLVLMTGCSTSLHKATPHKTKKTVHRMFQSVSKEKAVLLQKGKHKESCHICGMNLVKFYKTNHAAKENGITHQYCSIHCLTKDIKEGAELENPQVVDVSSLKFVPVTEAYYVVGSKKPATMSRISKYAFKSLKDAQAFQAQYGGKIVDFYSAWQIARKDFK